MTQLDAVVVGLGAVGSAVTLRLAERGLRVLGLDRFSPPHAHGSTHGETRITRLAIGEGADYVPLVKRSHELWREIEEQSATRLLHQTGGLVLGPRDGAFLDQTRAAARLHQIRHENLSRSELERRFPMFRPTPETEAYFEPDAGFLRPEAAVEAQLALAQRAGAELRRNETVQTWRASSTGVTLTTPTGGLEATELVLCVGAWISKLFPPGRELFAVHPQFQHWFPIRRGYEALRDMPVFIWEMGGDKAEFAHATGFYGFPALDGPTGGVKLATETYAATADPDDPWEPDPGPAARAFYEQHLARGFPWIGPEPVRSLPCLYTNTRGSRFIIDRHPDHANVTLVSACSGHGFKHSAAIGEAVAQLIASGQSQLDLGPFRLSSPARSDAPPGPGRE